MLRQVSGDMVRSFETSPLSVFLHLEKIPEFRVDSLIRSYLTMPFNLILNNEQSRSISSCGTTVQWDQGLAYDVQVNPLKGGEQLPIPRITWNVIFIGLKWNDRHSQQVQKSTESNSGSSVSLEIASEMLLLSAFIALFLIPPSWSAVLQRSVNFNCPDEGYFPIPGECSQYLYVCIQGQAYLSVHICHSLCHQRAIELDSVRCAPATTSLIRQLWAAPHQTKFHAFRVSSTSRGWQLNGQRPIQWNVLFLLSHNGIDYIIRTGINIRFNSGQDAISQHWNKQPISHFNVNWRCVTLRSITEWFISIWILLQRLTDTSATASTDSVPFTCADDGLFPLPGQCSGDYYFCSDGVA